MGDAPAFQQKYRLLAELGHGGMADVYLAVLKGPTDFTKLAVVKRLRSHLAEDPEFLAMFLQEARIAARLNHPNVVHTFEVGFDGKHHFIGMEYLQGHAYSALLARVGREKLDLDIQLRILIETLEGLQYAHDLKDFDGTPLGLVHRDVSPQNIFLTYDGQIKLLDFGIAKALDSAIETRTGVIKGKLSYMSPEQALAGELDRRADIYSVGVVLWEAIAARRRWKGLSNVQMMKKLVSSDEPIELPDPTTRGFPVELADILKKTLSRNPDARYAQASDFQAALERILESRGKRITARDVGKYVAEVFREDRERVLGVIDKELKRVDREVAVSSRADAINLVQLEVPTSSPVSGSIGGAARSVESPSLTDRPAAVSVPERRPADRPRSRWLYPLLALVLVSSAAIALGRGRLPIPGFQPRAEPVENQAPEQRTIKLSLSASPPQAELYLDDQRLGGNPHMAELQQAERNVTIRAELAGYAPESRTISLNTDVDLRFELLPQPIEASVEASGAPNVKSAPPRRGYVGRGSTVASAKAEPGAPQPPAATEPPPPAQPSEPAMKPPTKRPSSGVVLDTALPWEKK